MSYGRWAPYVPVAKRKANALKSMSKLVKNGNKIQPITISGREISTTFWGKAWCKQMESLSDFENRLPRGRTYVRNGSVCHLEVGEGKINAFVSGSSIYTVKIEIQPLPAAPWKSLIKKCAGQIGSIIELMQGKLSRQVMDVVTHPQEGLLPKVGDIKIHCSCPDGAYLCKHAAAVLYGVGARLDTAPELLFKLRGVDHNELLEATPTINVQTGTTQTGSGRRVTGDLAALFDIEMETEAPVRKPREKAIAAERQATKNPIKNREKPPAPKTVPPKPFQATSIRIIRLRKKLGMTQAQFASLLEISVNTLRLWEDADAPLNLRSRSKQALEWVARLDKDEAWKKLSE